MNKKTVILLVVLSFIVGFMTREMMQGMSGIIEDEYLMKKLSSNPQLQEQVEKYLVNNEKEVKEVIPVKKAIELKVLRVVNPPKALRGNAFDFFISVTGLSEDIKYYDLDVYLVSDNDQYSVGTFNLQTLVGQNKNQLGPIKVNTRPEFALGKYKIELVLKDRQTELGKLKIPEGQGEIEIISYN